MSTKKKSNGKRPNHDGTVYYDKINDRWIGQLPAVRKWDGTMKRPSVTGRTRDEVIEKKRLKEAQALSSEAVDPSKLTVKEWIDVYFKDFKNKVLSPTTIRDYQSIMDNYVIPAIGNMPLQKVQVINVQRILNAAEDKGLSSGRVIEIANTMASLFAQAKRARLIEHNIASPESCTRPKLEPTYEERAPLDKEAAGFWQEAETNPVALAVCLSLACGLRRGELLGLRWDDKDFNVGKIHVHSTVVEGNKGVCIKGPKSKAGKRTINAPDIALKALQRFKARLGTNKKLIGKGLGNQFVFQTQKGTHIAPSNFSRSYRSLRDKLGFTDLRLKSFRHGQATILDKINAPLGVRMELMGHAELKTTMETYTHPHNDQYQQVAMDINTVLAKVFGEENAQPDSTDKKAG